MGQSAIIFFAAAFLAGSLLLMSMQRDTQDADEQLQEHQYKLIARDAAVTGLNMAVRRLADDGEMGSWQSGSDYSFSRTTYDGNAFSVEVTPIDPAVLDDPGIDDGDAVDVVARGFAGDTKHAIFARYVRDKDDKGVPPAFRNVISSDLQLTIDGNLLVDAIDNSLNASIHSNEWVYVEANSFLVEGYGTYTVEPPKETKEKLQERFVPNNDINGEEPDLRKVEEPVKIPTINPEKLKGEAEESGTVANTSITISEPIDFTNGESSFWSSPGITYNCSEPPCGTEENPFVVYVEGDITFDGTVPIEGYGTIFSEGNISISGTGTYGKIDEEKQTQVLLATQEDIDIANNTCLGLGPSEYTRDASQPPVKTSTSWNNNSCTSPDNTYSHGLSLYAEGTVLSSGTPFIVGGVVAKSAEFNSKGNPWIAYAAPTETVIDSGFEYIIPVGPVLIAYSEW